MCIFQTHNQISATWGMNITIYIIIKIWLQRKVHQSKITPGKYCEDHGDSLSLKHKPLNKYFPNKTQTFKNGVSNL